MIHVRMRLIGMTFGLLALAAGTASCSSGQETASGETTVKKDGTVKIAYIQKQGDQQYFVDQANGAKEAAKGLGAQVTVFDVGEDADKAISAVDTAIAQKFDAIAVVVPDQQIGPQVIDRARAAGIPLLASDDVIKDGSGKEAPFVGFDGTMMGEQVGKKAAELFKESGWKPEETAVLSVTKLDLSVCQDRVGGAWDAFQKEGVTGVKKIDLGADNTVTGAQDKAAATVTANASVKHWVVWGCNDESETGAVTALANAGFGAKDVIGVGLGAYLTCKDWKAGKESGNRAALFISGTEVGRSAAGALVKKVRGEAELPPRTIAKTEMVDAGTWQQAGVVCT
ncbi:substrate-binding domain-containing protein [Streptosporangium sp. NPDC048047]|uniref:substrate-binding domain-containing protein n=1 Tax=Streptosporangium sp. NPDC048047 TaxID=3155748 RepID=UPI0034281F3F